MQHGYERRRLALVLRISLGFKMPRFGTALPSATRPPAAATPRHAHPTQQAPTPNSASGAWKTAPWMGSLGPRCGVENPPLRRFTVH